MIVDDDMRRIECDGRFNSVVISDMFSFKINRYVNVGYKYVYDIFYYFFNN